MGISGDQLARLIDMARRAMDAVLRAIDRGRRAGATESDREIAHVAQGCLDELRHRVRDLNILMAELRAARAETRLAMLTTSQVKALEAFALCAERLGDAVEAAAPAAPAESGAAVTGIVGMGLGVVVPVIAALASA